METPSNAGTCLGSSCSQFLGRFPSQKSFCLYFSEEFKHGFQNAAYQCSLKGGQGPSLVVRAHSEYQRRGNGWIMAPSKLPASEELTLSLRQLVFYMRKEQIYSPLAPGFLNQMFPKLFQPRFLGEQDDGMAAREAVGKNRIAGHDGSCSCKKYLCNFVLWCNNLSYTYIFLNVPPM